MKLKLIAAISAIAAIPALADAQQGGPQPNRTEVNKGGRSKRRPDRHHR
jgi:uncharacterized protein YdeI (BOF family)